MALRRSNRLADKLYERYFLEYHKIKISLKTISLKCVGSFSIPLTPENKIESIIKLANLMKENFAFFLKYEYTFTQNRHMEYFCDMLYKKLFDWIREASDLAPNIQVNFKKASKKYRQIYEKIRYANWEFIKQKFKLDDSIMFTINSYMHYYVTSAPRL